MTVTEALNARHSTRAFLSTPVEKEKLIEIANAAARTPSWTDIQPWNAFIATGETLDKIRKAYKENYSQNAKSVPETPRPTQWSETATKRQKEFFASIKTDCGDAASQFNALNEALFNAPAVMFLGADKVGTEWLLYDIGAYSQSVMLAAIERGLSTIPAVTLVQFPEVIRKEMEIPDDVNLVIGIAIGYADKEHGINKFITKRAPLDETVHFFD